MTHTLHWWILLLPDHQEFEDYNALKEMACVSPAPSLNAMPGWRCSHDAVEQCPTALSKTRVFFFGIPGFVYFNMHSNRFVWIQYTNCRKLFVYIQFYEQTHLREQMAKKGLPHLETKVVVKEYIIYWSTIFVRLIFTVLTGDSGRWSQLQTTKNFLPPAW